MRKIVLLVLAMLLLAVPAFAQDMMAEKTIAEIVVEAAGAETPEFSTLLAAVSAADPAVLEALSNPEAELTVFAPTDAAFAALAESLGEEAFNGVLADQATLTGILLFHVTSGKVMSADVVAALEANDGAFAVPSLQGQYIDITSDDMGVYINGAKLNLDMVDIEASNGVIHVIESVILPESRTIAEIVVESAGAETPEFSTLLAAVSAADPAVLETLSNPEAELTVFAPTDAAFAALAAALGEEAFNGVLADQAALTNILLYHVVPGIVRSGDLGALLEEHMSMSEDPLMVDTALEGKQVSFMVAEDGSVKINDATIIITDIDAANGVIHVINAVILPPSE
ncbi:MAG: fasciclin domain-containing protein [Chloroflexi bacterium]|nr:fasciclin domain-containing protein [Chloroflexota bacterium]MDL1884820.1 fasciclin domain-containing protein [Anaerolineae bacterium CFX8]